MIKLKWEQSEYRYPLQLLHDASGKVVGSGSFSVGGGLTVDGELNGSTLSLKHVVGRRELVTLQAELSRQKYMQGTWTYNQQRGGDISVSPSTGQWTADKISDGESPLCSHCTALGTSEFPLLTALELTLC